MLNQKIFDILFKFGNKHKKLTVFTTIYSCYLFFIMYIMGYIYIIYNIHKFGYKILIKYAFVPLVTIIIAKILRKKIKAKRPFEKLNITSLVAHKGGNSMPSNHSASAMVLALALTYILPQYFIFFIILAIITGVFRILAGLHYPIDVLFGFILGLIIGILGFFILF
ncbi:phosphatase PAP2 family protein [uncultured Tyzzerella sp.]|uniref:phosphatase PAP2 family protein n=1 Tax=uncultured Tyzzerella sp. TaxID=2321398 RepID=UPI002942E0EB|nr:phosphatase PAP2 family protein [uncultured Tyzzerella sp.]